MIRSLLLFLLVFATFFAAEPPIDPILRIETGFHTAMIPRVDASADGRFLLSVSVDKSLRLWHWDGKTIESEAVYRIPIGPGNEGKLYAGAISPDGRWVMSAGWTGWDWEKKCCVYLIDRRSGQLLRRFGDLPGVIFHLRVNPAGDRVLVCLGEGGVRCLRLPDGQELWRDSDYKDASYGACWLPNGTCATTSLDGHIRLYNPEGQITNKVTTPDGKNPFGIDQHDGILAVGYHGTMAVSLLDAKSLVRRGQFDTSAFDNGSLTNVCASQDRWWAGGSYHCMIENTKQYPIISLNFQDKLLRNHPRLLNTIFDLHPLPKGVLLAGGGPTLRVLNAVGDTVALRDGDTCDMRAKIRENFRIDALGQRCWFGCKQYSADPVLLDLTNGTFASCPLAPEVCVSPTHLAPGLDLQGWEGTTNVTLNGKKIVLDNYETTLSCAIPANRQLVILGTEWNFWALAPDGQIIWQQPAPGSVQGVHCPSQAPVVVAACGDGTLRWHRLSDGKEILACFPHKDGKRWVAWTPSGYYWAGPGSEDLIGWHINRGKDQLADFYPASRFRARYNRPDIVQAIFETWDEAKAIALVNETRRVDTTTLATILPPVVEILSPTDGESVSKTQVSISLRLRSAADAPVTNLRVLFNSQEVAAQRGMRPVSADDTTTLTVTIPTQSGILSVIAENRHGASVPASRQIVWAGATVNIKPVCYVLAVGVGKYSNPNISRLTFPVADAKAIAAGFSAQKGQLFRDVQVQIVNDGNRLAVMKGLNWLKKNCTNQDLAVIFLAGHGENDDQGAYHFLPSDTDPEDFASTAVPFSAIIATINGLPGKRLAFLDTCRAGNVTGGLVKRSAGNAADQALNALASAENGCVVFAAATGKQAALEQEAWGHGAFTLAVIEALNGTVPTDATPLLKQILAEKTLSVNLLNTYIAERVKQLTSGQQSPTMQRPATVPDFPIALRP